MFLFIKNFDNVLQIVLEFGKFNHTFNSNYSGIGHNLGFN